MTNEQWWDEVNKYQAHRTSYDVWDHALIITEGWDYLKGHGICKACFRFGQLIYSECVDCRH
jgi:hypothetical protein